MSPHKSQFVNPQTKVIVSFTTIASRINYTEAVVNSILKQSIPPDSFELYLSDHPSLFQGGIDTGIKSHQIPTFLLKLVEQNKLKIKYVPNIGPANKLIPALREYQKTDDIIITVDDDMVYPPHMIALLLQGYQQEKCAVALRGRHMKFINQRLSTDYNGWPLIRQRNKAVDNFITGTFGALYKASFFHKHIFNTAHLLHLSPTNDDIWFHFMRVINHTSALIIPHNVPSHSQSHQHSKPLYRINITQNQKTLKKMLNFINKKFKYNPTVHIPTMAPSKRPTAQNRNITRNIPRNPPRKTIVIKIPSSSTIYAFN